MADALDFTEFLTASCPAFSSDFTPHPFLPAAAAQTGAADFMNRVDGANSRREFVPCATREGKLAIDWLDEVDGDRTIEPDGPPPPLVIGFPGTGSCKPDMGLAAVLLTEVRRSFGGRCHVGLVVYPGLGGTPLNGSLPISAGSGLLDDAGDVLRAARARHPSSPLLIIACSVGSAIYVNWACRHPSEVERLGISAAMCLGYGETIRATIDEGDSYAYGLFGRVATRRWWSQLCQTSMAELGALEVSTPGFSMDRLRAARSIWEWEAACAPLYGYRSAEELVTASEPKPHLDAYSVPTLFLNAEDDMVCPASRLRDAPNDFERVRTRATLATRHGGHLGWVDTLPSRSGIIAGSHCQWLCALSAQFVRACASRELTARGGRGVGAIDSRPLAPTAPVGGSCRRTDAARRGVLGWLLPPLPPALVVAAALLVLLAGHVAGPLPRWRAFGGVVLRVLRLQA